MRQHGEFHPDIDTAEHLTRPLRHQYEERMVSESLDKPSLEHL